MWVRFLAAGLLVLTTGGCGMDYFTDRAANPFIEDRMGFINAPIVLGAVTADRRTVLVRTSDNPEVNGLTCAEPSPDAITAVASMLRLSLSDPSKSAATAEFGKALGIASTSIFARSQGLQLYRDASFQLCQAYINAALRNTPFDFATWRDDNNRLLDVAKEILMAEIAGGFHKVSQEGKQITIEDAAKPIGELGIAKDKALPPKKDAKPATGG